MRQSNKLKLLKILTKKPLFKKNRFKYNQKKLWHQNFPKLLRMISCVKKVREKQSRMF